MTPVICETVQSPLGDLLLAANHDGLTHLLFTPLRSPLEHAESSVALGSATAILQLARGQLDEYFAGSRHTFTVPLAAAGTVFQRMVWQSLSAIPYGQTRSYRDVAHAIGRPKAMRAVGLANGRNPISIIVPCHRVIGANGSLTGYGGGIERKQQLLALETAAALSSTAGI